jgi:hypothetical protein
MALDDGVGDSLFKNIKKQAPQANQNALHPQPVEKDSERSAQDVAFPEPQKPLAQKQVQQQEAQAVPKWQTLDKVMVLLTTEQKEGLDRIAKRIMKFRSKEIKGQEKERITANTLIRALVDNFLKHEESVQLEVVTSEDDVKEWVRKLFK